MDNIIKAKVNSYVKDLVETKQFSGSVLVAKGDNIIINNGYGMANYDLNVPNTPKTKFRIASITKSITAMAILILADEKKLGIEDTLDKYIPDYPNGNIITIYHLITHTSGIYELNRDEEYKNFAYKDYTLENLIEKFRDMPLDFQPAKRFEYSNSGYVLLGFIIEKVSGKTYEEYVSENIFDRLSMKDSGAFTNEHILLNKANGYSKQGEEIINSKLANLFNGGGNLYSTVEDIYVWSKALKEGSLLSKEYNERLLTEHAYAEDDDYYGYGFVLHKPDNHIEYIYQDGGLSGYKSIYMIYPAEDFIIIILSNFDFIKVQDIAQQIKQLI